MDGSPSSLRAVFVLTVVTSLSLLFSVTGSEGQTTSITPSLLPSCSSPCSGSPTAVFQSGSTVNIYGGARPGSGVNLFHSFQDFSVGTGDTALFRAADIGGAGPLPYNGNSIQNIIGRVTGNNPSGIFGTLNTQSAFPTANLFLINPAGIVFGPSASLNVGGSVHFSTADYLRLGSGNDRFYADLGKTSQLTSTPVTAFGFLGSSQGQVDVKGELLQAIPSTLSPPLKAADGHTISLIGGDISIQGRRIQASGGQINLVSMSAGEVSLTPNGPQLSPGSLLGTISLTAKPPDAVNKFPTHTELTTNVSELNRQAGDIFIRSGQLVIDDSSLSAFAQIASGSDPSGFTSGGNILVTATNMNLSKSTLTVSTSGNTAAGSLVLQGQEIILQNNTSLRGLSILSFGAPLPVGATGGRAGTVTIEGINGPAHNVTVSNSKINTEIGTAGNGANLPAEIRIVSQAVTLTDHAQITADTHGAAPAGNISINAATVGITNGATISSSSTSTSPSAGSAGQILMRGQNGEGSSAQSVTLDNSTIQTMATGGKFVNLSDNGDQADPSFGQIHINAQSVSVANGATIRSDTSAVVPRAGLETNEVAVPAGAITLLAGSNLSLTSGATISSSSTASAQIQSPETSPSLGNAGNIQLTSGDSISLTNNTVSTSATQASGGNITLTAPNLVRLVGGTLTSSVSGPPGSNGGNITIDTAHPQFVIMQGNSQILAKANEGQGGAIRIIGGLVFQEPGSVLDATAGPAGVSGTINIQAPIQQLSGAIAPLPQAFAVATNLYGQRCATQKGGQFSSFVQGARDGVPPQPGDLIPSPLLLESDGTSPSLGAQSSPNLAAVRLGLPEFDHPGPATFLLSAGCRS